MKNVFLAIILGCSFSLATAAADPTPPTTAQTQYFYAVARLVSLNVAIGNTPGAVTPQFVLLARTLDPVGSTITEIACINGPGFPAMLSPVYMQVSGNKITAISDTPDFAHPKNLSGTGTLFGPAWNWSQLNFNMTYSTCAAAKCSTQINDSNFVINTTDVNNNPINQLIGRKQIFAADGTPLELYDLEMNLITLAQYNTVFAQMACPALSTITPPAPTPPVKPAPSTPGPKN